MSENPVKFSCEGCQRTYTWKEPLAGKRAKCKCGHVMTIPQKPPQPEPPQEEDDLYALADTGASHKSAAPRPVAAIPVATAAVAAPQSSAVPLGYQRGPTARDDKFNATETYIDPKRDYFIPLILLGIGVILHLSFYAIHYSSSLTALLILSIGLLLVTLFETAILVGFALVIANPLGVSFGLVGPAILKLATVVVFSDGITVWVDAFAERYLGMGPSIFGFNFLTFPVTFLIYMILFIKLFGMDPSDSRFVVAILSVFYRILRLVLMLLLLGLVFHLSGIARTAAAIPGANNVASALPNNAQDDEVDRAKGLGLLREARQFIHDRNMGSILPAVNEWYADGAPNVWINVTRDINQHETPFELVVELPADPVARAKCMASKKTWYNVYHQTYDPKLDPDTGGNYLVEGLY